MRCQTASGDGAVKFFDISYLEITPLLFSGCAKAGTPGDAN